MEINDVLTTLREDYALRRSLRRKQLNVQEELEEEIENLEQSYLTSYIIPQLQQQAKELIKDMECELYLSIVHDGSGEVRVSNEYEFVPDERGIIDGKDQTPRAGSKGFRVKFPDGTIIQNRDAKETLIRTLLKIGLDEAAKFQSRKFKDYPLVGRLQRNDGVNKWQEKVDGWYIYINISNETKIKILEQLSSELGLGLEIERLGDN